MIGECPSPNREGCPLYEKGRKCKSNTHSKFWPRNRYTTPLEKEFRELPENKQHICRQVHEDIHEFEYAPDKPSIHAMLAAISRAATGEEL